MGIKFEFFEASNGDSILVSTDDKTNILIDGGVASTYRDKITYSLDKLNGNLDLVVVTHIDTDHICGIIELLNDRSRRKKISKLWFNMASEKLIFWEKDREVGSEHGNLLTKFIDDNHIPYKNNIYFDKKDNNNNIFIIGSIQLTLISPNKDALLELRRKWTNNDIFKKCKGSKVEIGAKQIPQDNRDIDYLYNLYISGKIEFGKKDTYSNTSSIAFILEHENKKFLFLGDADIGIINTSLKKLGYLNKDNERLRVEFVKLSHHGSKNNINEEFLNLVETNTFIILTNGKHPANSDFKHPDKETIMLILKHSNRKENIKFIFNYPLPKTNKFPNYIKDKKKYKFRVDIQNILEYK